MIHLELQPDTSERNLGKRTHKCRICGNTGLFQSYLSREMMQGTKEEFEYFVCSECDCLQIAEIPENLAQYYGKDYYSFAKSNNFVLDESVPVEVTQKLLDVGCGSGKWLIDLANAGFSQLWGCDPFLENDINYGDRIHIRKCSIHEIKEDHSFDYIHMGDSFEHMTDPLEVLKSARRLLAPFGIIEILIPTYPNIAFDMFGPHWYQLDAPRHISLHSKKSIQYLASKAGLWIEEITYDSDESEIFTSWLYQNGIPAFIDLAPEKVGPDITHILTQYFSEEEINNISKMVEQCNEMGYGDHMKLIMRAI